MLILRLDTSRKSYVCIFNIFQDLKYEEDLQICSKLSVGGILNVKYNKQ